VKTNAADVEMIRTMKAKRFRVLIVAFQMNASF